jgi:Na+-translocating ferredoxin:NAD+ oxidoreductase RnfG subunit
MNQYRGKSSSSLLQVGKDIVGVSGATISSRAATFTVKKAIVIYEEVHLHK